jgi:hypothetical protein
VATQAGASGQSSQGTAAEGKPARAADGRPSGLVLAGAGSLLAVLAFLGGTAVGHAWGGSGDSQQQQFPGGGFRQFPGQGTQPGQGSQQGQGNQQGQGTQPGLGTQSQGTTQPG